MALEIIDVLEETADEEVEYCEEELRSNLLSFSYLYLRPTLIRVGFLCLIRKLEDRIWCSVTLLIFSYFVNTEIHFMDSIETIISEVVKFRNERDWEQFHNSKDLALAISIEAGELNELFLWKKAEEVNVEKLKEELADVFTFAFLLANKYGLNVKELVLEKLKTNAVKYPVDKAKGTAKKYNEL